MLSAFVCSPSPALLTMVHVCSCFFVCLFVCLFACFRQLSQVQTSARIVDGSRFQALHLNAALRLCTVMFAKHLYPWRRGICSRCVELHRRRGRTGTHDQRDDVLPCMVPGCSNLSCEDCDSVHVCGGCDTPCCWQHLRHGHDCPGRHQGSDMTGWPEIPKCSVCWGDKVDWGMTHSCKLCEVSRCLSGVWCITDIRTSACCSVDACRMCAPYYQLEPNGRRDTICFRCLPDWADRIRPGNRPMRCGPW